MTNTNVTKFRENIFNYADSCLKFNDIVNVSTKNGNVVVMSEDEYNGLVATLELCAISEMEKSLIEGRNTPSNEMEEFVFDEKL